MHKVLVEKPEGTTPRRRQQNNYTVHLKGIEWEMAMVRLVQRTLLHIFTKLQVPQKKWLVQLTLRSQKGLRLMEFHILLLSKKNNTSSLILIIQIKNIYVDFPNIIDLSCISYFSLQELFTLIFKILLTCLVFHILACKKWDEPGSWSDWSTSRGHQTAMK